MVAVMATYHVTARREGRWWALRCEELPGVFSQVARLDKAADEVREAIAFVADIQDDSFDIVVTPVLPEAYRIETSQAEAARSLATQANQEAAAHARAAARALADAGLTVRDIGTVIGVSHQRAAQLLAK
jgi:predicted RNase H-like HicB family nuclease